MSCVAVSCQPLEALDVRRLLIVFGETSVRAIRAAEWSAAPKYRWLRGCAKDEGVQQKTREILTGFLLRLVLRGPAANGVCMTVSRRRTAYRRGVNRTAE